MPMFRVAESVGAESVTQCDVFANAVQDAEFLHAGHDRPFRVFANEASPLANPCGWEKDEELYVSKGEEE